MIKPIENLKSIFEAGLKSVDPNEIILNKVAVKGDFLSVTHDGKEHAFDLSKFKKIYIVGAGKATARMALAMEGLLGDRITGGVISVKYGHSEKLTRIKVIEAAHPVPDENSRRAAEEIHGLCRELTEECLVICLISGGGSALLSMPVKEITDRDKRGVTEMLLACGADICEINCVRKHLSSIKGGRLIQAVSPAVSVNLILSDVIGDRLDSIASGLTSHDDTTFGDAVDILEKYELADKVPARVRAYLLKGVTDDSLETPKKGGSIFAGNHNFIIGSNIVAVREAAAKAREMRFNTVVLSSQIMGEAKVAAANYAGICMDIKRSELLAKRPACIIAGGETTVTIKGTGKGGRNQEMALAFLKYIAENRSAMEGVYFLSAATDGNDGPTDAAGGFACLEMLDPAPEAGSEINECLKNNDSYHYLKEKGLLYVTGPTNTNVCDLQIMIVS
ncbi:MAG: glycerate kinase [Desulfobacteraceae bacterium]|nr:glycerate kinase [Desulfobacteraceae bacterium]